MKASTGFILPKGQKDNRIKTSSVLAENGNSKLLLSYLP
jgi:hypothetical protein